MYVVGWKTSAEDAAMSMSVTNVWMLMNYFRVINTEWTVQIMGDATFNFCDAPIALMEIGVMQAGGKLAPLIYSLAPTKSAEAYTLMWDGFAKSAVSFVRKYVHL